MTVVLRARGRATPKSLQTSVRRAHDGIRAAIRIGLLPRDEQLVEDSLVRSLATSRNAVREALRILAQEGLVVREPRRGTVVSGRILEISISELVPAGCDGADPLVKVGVEPVEHRVIPSTGLLRMRLETNEDEVLMIEQVATFEGEAIYVRTAYLRLGPTPQLLAERVTEQGHQLPPVGTAFESLFGVPIGDRDTVVEARSCDERTSRLLRIPEGSPVLMREVLLRDSGGTPRELSYTHYRADRVSLSIPAHAESQPLCGS
jgi:GntR family transcriptional regulator